MTDLLLVQLFNGLMYSALLFIVASGLSLIFGLMNVVNLMHGSFFMLGAFLSITITAWTGSYWAAFLLAPVLAAIVGLMIELLLMRRLYGRGHVDQILLTFGLSLVGFDAVKWLWGADIHALDVPTILSGSLPILDGGLPIYRAFLIILGAVVYSFLWFVLDHSRLGAMVRASVDDSGMASGLGINVGVLFSAVFAAGVALAALAGVAAAPIMGIYAGMDTDILIPAFIVVVIGGMGSLTGALVGSLLIGLADTFGKAFLPDLALFLVYLVMVVVLIKYPTGLFGPRI